MYFWRYFVYNIYTHTYIQTNRHTHGPKYIIKTFRVGSAVTARYSARSGHTAQQELVGLGRRVVSALKTHSKFQNVAGNCVITIVNYEIFKINMYVI